MKEKEINEIIEDKFKILNKLSQKITRKFDVDDIHDFRVEVKKLRAFLRLLDNKKGNDESIIPKLLKTFYGYVGIIRNIQLYKHSLFKYFTDHDIDEPEKYLAMITDEETYWQQEAQALMADNNFQDVKEKIIKELPYKLDKSTIEKFTDGKLDDLKRQLKDTHDDVGLHTIRKILKDIFYNYDDISDDSDLPEAILDKDELKLLTQILGDFIDKYMQLEFLQPEYLDKIEDGEEKNNLLQMKNDFEHEKHGMKQELQHSLERLQQQL
jgi:CHAD domain-containing protein